MLYLLLVIFTIVELNCENLFDTRHDSLKLDEEFLPTSSHRWTPSRYWKKINHINQTIMSCGESDTLQWLPDLVVLTEVENDSVMRDLAKRSPLRHVRYEYVMTDSPDLRGIDVALLYSPFSFQLVNHHSIRIEPLKGMRPTRDILYASGRIINGDTLHVFAVHAPSRAGGEASTMPYRMRVAKQLCEAIDSVFSACAQPLVVVAGDFNDYSGDASLKMLVGHNMKEVSLNAKGGNGAKGTYRYHGAWGSLDHIFCNHRMASLLIDCHVNDAPFLLEKDKKYGGVKPRRTYLGPRYIGGFSDHLPLVAIFKL